jgi:hypothetical protein
MFFLFTGIVSSSKHIAYSVESKDEEMDGIRQGIKLVNFKNCTGLCWKVEMSNTKIFIYVSW